MAQPGPPPPWGNVAQRPPKPLPKWPFVLGGGILLFAVTAFALIFIVPFAIMGKVFTDLDRASTSAKLDRAARTRVAEAVGPPAGYVEAGRVEDRACITDCAGVKLVFLPASGTAPEDLRSVLGQWVEASGVALADRRRTEDFLRCAESRATSGGGDCRLSGRKHGQPVTFVTTDAADVDHPAWSGRERVELVVGPEPSAGSGHPGTTPTTR